MASCATILIDALVLPQGTIVHSCNRYGSSAWWTTTARIETTLANGEPEFFFLKVFQRFR